MSVDTPIPQARDVPSWTSRSGWTPRGPASPVFPIMTH